MFKYWIIILGIAIFSCHTNISKSNQTYIDRKKDIDIAIPIGIKFYNHLKKGEYTNALDLFGISAFKIKPKDEILLSFRQDSIDCGKLLSFNLTNSYSFAKEGKDSLYNCTLHYMITYDRCKREELLYFVKENNHVIIKGHAIQ